MAFLGERPCSAWPSALGPRLGPLIASPGPAGPWTRPWLDDGASCDVLIVSIGTLSLSHVNVSGRSPVTTTHCTLVRSPTFKSRAKLKGVILGGTERTIQRQKVAFQSKRFRTLENSRVRFSREGFCFGRRDVRGVRGQRVWGESTHVERTVIIVHQRCQILDR